MCRKRSVPLFTTRKTEIAPISADPFAPVKKEFGSLYSGFKGRADKGAVRHALRIVDVEAEMLTEGPCIKFILLHLPQLKLARETL
jgi:hypothetical protein